jgi:LacI family transcriptional regulator
MQKQAKRPTIKEVASAAGVSTQTVSRVMNDRPDVSPETRERVLKVIEQLGYQPSALARSLIQQRSYTLGVVTAGLKYIGPSRTLSGITTAAAELGYSLLLIELPSFDTNKVIPILQDFHSRHVDGIIWAVQEVGENRKWLENPPLRFEVPIVFLSMHPREHTPIVSIDNYLGGRQVMAHLFEQGYRNIGHISGPLEWWESRERMSAWKDALKENGIKARDNHWVEGNWSSSSGARAAQVLFEKYPEMDAVFAANDQMALSVLQAACERSLSVPKDFGIVGFDNLEESPYFCPSLSTVQVEQQNMGKAAVERIVRIIEAGWQNTEVAEPLSVVFKPTLVVRESSNRRMLQIEKEVVAEEINEFSG